MIAQITITTMTPMTIQAVVDMGRLLTGQNWLADEPSLDG